MYRYLRPSLLVLLLTTGLTASDSRLVLDVRDEKTLEPIESRIYLRGIDGTDYYFETLSASGSAVKYQKQNWINKQSIENHTTVSAHTCYCELPSGRYELLVERGKTYFTHRETINVVDSDVHLVVHLREWCKAETLGWYSGDLHLHREVEDLRNVILAEDLNVAFPLVNWVTQSATPPSRGDKNHLNSDYDDLVRVDRSHVIWPLNTEYEIFSVGEKRHTLGALFALGHLQPLQATVPPWKPVIQEIKASGHQVLLDMDKLAWPASMVLPTIAPDAIYELANNHLWRTEFAFRQWTTTAPPFLCPPYGSDQGGEKDWIDFTLGMYYCLLNSGFRLPPGAGTANGVHPVPAGFSRVYVHLEDGFDFDSWKAELQAGRSFVTTGPMLFATANSFFPGQVFTIDKSEVAKLQFDAQFLSQNPVLYAELICNGEPIELIRPNNQRLMSGAYQTRFHKEFEINTSSWLAIRVFEQTEDGRIRFAHTAPWYVEKAGSKIQPTFEQKQFLVSRLEEEIARSRGIVSDSAMNEYQNALRYYESLEVKIPKDLDQTSRALHDTDEDKWLANMILDHQFTASEIQAATGSTLEQAQTWIRQYKANQFNLDGTYQLKVLPYPGGRHPRRGFLEGAINPQRETKISVFPPWKDGGYVVVDVPEAIFSNLGLTYLAHTHIPTIWTEAEMDLEPLEWLQQGNKLTLRRTLPNGISLCSTITWDEAQVSMHIELENGTRKKLSGLRVQVCTMLKGLTGFQSQQRLISLINGPLIAVKSVTDDRWLITGWTPLNRCWDNPPVPCIHSDPIFPDCEPGQKVAVTGRLWFYEGQEIQQALAKFKQEILTP
jgi:hypothetical protein